MNDLKVEKYEIIKIISKKDIETFNNIENHILLGASNHISVIGNMIENIVNEKKDICTIIKDIKKLSNYYIQTRGKASQAITNAINIMTKGIENYDLKLGSDEIKRKIIEAKNSYYTYSKHAVEKCIEYSLEVLKNKKNILLFDYSSTVEKSILKLSNENHNIYISESRVIDGGKPFLEKLLKKEFIVKYFPDAALLHNLKKCDVVLMGAETFYPDGTCFNTTGSDMLGILCEKMMIPLYFITPLIKADSRVLRGIRKEMVNLDLKNKLSQNLDEKLNVDKVDFLTPELLPIDANNITGIITEKGIFSPNEIYKVCMDFLKEIGENYE